MRPRPTFRTRRHRDEGELVVPVTVEELEAKITLRAYGLEPRVLPALAELLAELRAMRPEALASMADVRATLESITDPAAPVDLYHVDTVSRGYLDLGARHAHRALGADALSRAALAEAARYALRALPVGRRGPRSKTEADARFIHAVVGFLQKHSRHRLPADKEREFAGLCARVCGFWLISNGAYALSSRLRSLFPKRRRGANSGR